MKGPRMTAQFDSQDPRDPSQQSSHEYENYVPEREFVLMPFFRRIGRRLGFGGNPAEQSTYAEPPEEATSELPPVEQADLPQAPVAQQEVEAEIAPAVVTFHSGAASASEDKDAAYPISRWTLRKLLHTALSLLSNSRPRRFPARCPAPRSGSSVGENRFCTPSNLGKFPPRIWCRFRRKSRSNFPIRNHRRGTKSGSSQRRRRVQQRPLRRKRMRS